MDFEQDPPYYFLENISFLARIGYGIALLSGILAGYFVYL